MMLAQFSLLIGNVKAEISQKQENVIYILVIPEVYIDGKLVKTLSNGETYEEYV